MFLNYIMENSTTHGGSWVSKVKWTPLRVLLQGLVIVTQLGMLIVVILMLLLENPWKQKNTSITAIKADDLPYPSFTVCNPRPFDKEIATKLNLSEKSLTLLALPSFFRDADHIFMNYFKNQSMFDDHLAALALKHDLITLMQDVLIKCESFIVFCNQKALLSNHFDCCQEIFDPKPFLSEYGACFSTKSSIGTSKDGMLEVMLNVSEEYTIGIDKTIGGPRRSFIPHTLAFNGNNHPFVALEKEPMSLVPGTYSSLKLKARVVRLSESLQYLLFNSLFILFRMICQITKR